MEAAAYIIGSTMSEESRALPIADLKDYEVYALIGGDEGGASEAFAALAKAFYAGVAEDPVLRPLYPDDDLEAAAERLTFFLIQRFGGPALYAEKRGHPRLRMRHHPFAIGPAERDAWLHHINAAIDTVPAFAPVAEIVRAYFRDAAYFLQNRP